MREIKIALLGLGTVGSGVIEIIRRRKNEWLERYGAVPTIQKILVRDLTKKRSVDVAPELLTTDLQEIIKDPEIQVIVEVMGGDTLALESALQGIRAGKHLVTANKLMLALHGPTLYKEAEKHGVLIEYEASVGGGIPIIQPLQESLNANAIQTMMGIVNGTTNYILTAMSQNEEGYYDVLERAQALGYAEADPSSDVDGLDACYKLSILTGVAYGKQLPVPKIPTTGISKISLMEMELAEELGYTIKLVATAKRQGDQITGHVHPTFLTKDHPLVNVHGVNNALYLKGDAVGQIMLYGPGAGMLATGSAVTSDLIRICRRLALEAKFTEENGKGEGKIPLLQDRYPVFYENSGVTADQSRYFVTIQTVAKPKVAQIGARLDQTGLPIERISIKDRENLYLIGIMTDKCTPEQLERLIQTFASDAEIRQINYYYIEGGV